MIQGWSHSERQAARLGDEPVPSLAAGVDDGAVARAKTRSDRKRSRK